jgi:hypothetical protein
MAVTETLTPPYHAKMRSNSCKPCSASFNAAVVVANTTEIVVTLGIRAAKRVSTCYNTPIPDVVMQSSIFDDEPEVEPVRVNETCEQAMDQRVERCTAYDR